MLVLWEGGSLMEPMTQSQYTALRRKRDPEFRERQRRVVNRRGKALTILRSRHEEEYKEIFEALKAEEEGEDLL